MATLIEQLTLRAERALSNPAEVTAEDISSACAEAVDLAEGRAVPETVMLDLAFYRLKLRLGGEPSETDDLIYQAALRKVREAPAPDSGLPEGRVKPVVRNRSSQWEL